MDVLEVGNFIGIRRVAARVAGTIVASVATGVGHGGALLVVTCGHTAHADDLTFCVHTHTQSLIILTTEQLIESKKAPLCCKRFY